MIEYAKQDQNKFVADIEMSFMNSSMIMPYADYMILLKIQI